MSLRNAVDAPPRFRTHRAGPARRAGSATRRPPLATPGPAILPTRAPPGPSRPTQCRDLRPPLLKPHVQKCTGASPKLTPINRAAAPCPTLRVQPPPTTLRLRPPHRPLLPRTRPFQPSSQAASLPNGRFSTSSSSSRKTRSTFPTVWRRAILFPCAAPSPGHCPKSQRTRITSVASASSTGLTRCSSTAATSSAPAAHTALTSAQSASPQLPFGCELTANLCAYAIWRVFPRAMIFAAEGTGALPAGAATRHAVDS
mmetsp:Transcript_24520/g.78276  ORF Transcript_24520/g.78276 Transcript_24520/m.78276 type:complete len:257 (-) Transcript_24520:308-1078(-)